MGEYNLNLLLVSDNNVKGFHSDQISIQILNAHEGNG